MFGAANATPTHEGATPMSKSVFTYRAVITINAPGFGTRERTVEVQAFNRADAVETITRNHRHNLAKVQSCSQA